MIPVIFNKIYELLTEVLALLLLTIVITTHHYPPPPTTSQNFLRLYLLHIAAITADSTAVPPCAPICPKHKQRKICSELRRSLR